MTKGKGKNFNAVAARKLVAKWLPEALQEFDEVHGRMISKQNGHALHDAEKSKLKALKAAAEEKRDGKSVKTLEEAAEVCDVVTDRLHRDHISRVEKMEALADHVHRVVGYEKEFGKRGLHATCTSLAEASAQCIVHAEDLKSDSEPEKSATEPEKSGPAKLVTEPKKSEPVTKLVTEPKKSESESEKSASEPATKKRFITYVVRSSPGKKQYGVLEKDDGKNFVIWNGLDEKQYSKSSLKTDDAAGFDLGILKQSLQLSNQKLQELISKNNSILADLQ